jgi:hypothetical protein
MKAPSTPSGMLIVWMIFLGMVAQVRSAEPDADVELKKVITAWIDSRQSIRPFRCLLTETSLMPKLKETKSFRAVIDGGGVVEFSQSPKSVFLYKITYGATGRFRATGVESPRRPLPGGNDYLFDGQAWYSKERVQVVIRRTSDMPGIFTLDPTNLLPLDLKSTVLEQLEELGGKEGELSAIPLSGGDLLLVRRRLLDGHKVAQALHF